VFAWSSWRIYLIENDAYISFSNKIQLSSLWQIILGTNSDYQQQVWQAFLHKPFSPILPIGITETEFSFGALFLALLVLYFFVFWIYRKRENGKQFTRTAIVGFVATLLYLVGMGAMYLFKFTKEEALVLASYGRYIGIPLLMLFVYLLGITGELLCLESRWKKRVLIVFVLLLVMIAPAQESAAFLLGRNREYSNNVRAQVDRDAAYVFKLLDEKPYKINVVSFENYGLDFLMMRFVMRPNHVAGAWHIKYQLFNPDDMWYDPPKDAQQWCSRLVEEGFDYVYLYQTDPGFSETYASSFMGGSTPQDHMLYSVDPTTGLLSLVMN
jgi:hypothetical protein